MNTKIESMFSKMKAAAFTLVACALCATAITASAQQQVVPATSKFSVVAYPLTNAVGESATVVFGGQTNQLTNIVTSILYTNNTGSGSPGFFTNSVTNIFTNVVYPWINLTGQSKVAIEISYNCSGSSTATNYVTFAHSLDAIYSNISTAQNIVVGVVDTGTTKVIVTTNLANLGDGYLLPYSALNGSVTGSEYSTNWQFRYGIKQTPF